VTNHNDGQKVILNYVLINPLDNSLGGESISGHVIATLIIAGENPTDFAGLNFRLDGTNNLLVSLLPYKWSIPMVILTKNNFPDGLITQTRCWSNLEARCESLELNLGIAEAICSSILVLEAFVFLFSRFQTELQQRLHKLCPHCC
jgi:hypothetical protein